MSKFIRIGVDIINTSNINGLRLSNKTIIVTVNKPITYKKSFLLYKKYDIISKEFENLSSANAAFEDLLNILNNNDKTISYLQEPIKFKK